MDWPKITDDTPLEEIKRIHQQIWQYVVENGEKPKTPYIQNCVLCEYGYVLAGHNTSINVGSAQLTWVAVAEIIQIGISLALRRKILRNQLYWQRKFETYCLSTN